MPERTVRNVVTFTFQVQTPQLKAGSQLAVNVYLQNANSNGESIVDLYRAFRVELVENVQEGSDSRTHARFLKEAKRAYHMLPKEKTLQTIDPNQQLWNSLGTSPLTQEQIDGMVAGTNRFYVYVWARWKNEARDLDECFWLQQPQSATLSANPLIWHTC
jgi:hypothetical protein